MNRVFWKKRDIRETATMWRFLSNWEQDIYFMTYWHQMFLISGSGVGLRHQPSGSLSSQNRRWTVCALPRVHSILGSGRFHSMDCKGESSATRMLLCYGRQFVDTLYHTKSASLISHEFFFIICLGRPSSNAFSAVDVWRETFSFWFINVVSGIFN